MASPLVGAFTHEGQWTVTAAEANTLPVNAAVAAHRQATRTPLRRPPIGHVAPSYVHHGDGSWVGAAATAGPLPDDVVYLVVHPPRWQLHLAGHPGEGQAVGVPGTSGVRGLGSVPPSDGTVGAAV